MKKILFLFSIISVVLISSCGDSCSSYSDFSCRQIEKASYNVYFYYPSGDEVFLGEAQGLKTCGAISYDHAYSKNLQSNSDWSYICCMIAKGSSCYEKHR